MLSNAQPFHIIESNLHKRYSNFADNDSCGVNRKTYLIHYHYVIKGKKHIPLYTQRNQNMKCHKY